MFYGDYGNYDSRIRQNKFDMPFGNDKKVSDMRTASPGEPILSFKKAEVEAKSTDALGAYGMAAFNMQKVNVPAIPLSDSGQAMVARYVTPEQQQRISDDFLAYFG